MTVDIVTDRGRIQVTEGSPGLVVVSGVATVRAGFTVPAMNIRAASYYTGRALFSAAKELEPAPGEAEAPDEEAESPDQENT